MLDKFKYDISKIDFFVLFIFIIYCGHASSLIENDKYFIIVSVFFFILFIYKKRKFDVVIVFTVLYWLFVNFLSSLIFNQSQGLSINSLLGSVLRLLFSYFVVKIIANNFLKYYIHIVYLFSIISVIIYLFQLFNPFFFYSIASRFSFLTQSEQAAVNGFNMIIYMFSSWAPERNCGFAWEPGGFAFFLTVAIILRLLINSFKFDKYIVVFLITIITTLSTSGIMALLVLSFIYLIKVFSKKVNPLLVLVSLLIPFVVVYLFTTVDILGGKINEYDQGKDDESTVVLPGESIERINRIGEFERSIESSVYNNPFGNGILDNEYRIRTRGKAVGPNSISDILNKWGYFGLLLFIFSVYKLFNSMLTNMRGNKIATLLCVIAFFIPVFSNPYSGTKPLVFALFFYYFIFVYKNKNWKPQEFA